MPSFIGDATKWSDINLFIDTMQLRPVIYQKCFSVSIAAKPEFKNDQNINNIASVMNVYLFQ
jgi:hypothetical protein